MNQNQSKTKIGPYIKSSAAYGLIMGAIVWIFAAIFGPIYCCSGLDINLFTGFVIGEVLAIIIGLLVAVSCSIIFFMLIYFFAQRATKEFAVVRDKLAQQEPIFYDGAANHRVGKESVGGWMFLYGDRLYYMSHMWNNQVHEMYIPLQDIKGMNCPKKFLNDTTLDIALADGRVEQFAVYEPKVWAARINERYRLLQQMPKDA
ncbi:MAG: hypothetical protein IJZ42_02760 [Lachnospiraceae bacterium]|nr:hypothetical protein [Lachnospiraceae bacterium]